MISNMHVAITTRPYQPADEDGWLRCRVLSFLQTAYFDDVKTEKTALERPAVELVAAIGDRVVGVIDVEIDEAAATIDTIAVHPDHGRIGVASTLLREVIRLLPASVRTLDAWTRDDVTANAWYQREGFAETFRYLHVYASSDAEIASAARELSPNLVAVKAFFHAPIAAEAEMRATYKRVHVCRHYERVL
ncbi:MAG TPA: GNAT family N-acetyltransferase [Acidimicrobiales bacterium]|nr:GNAT family N-acetyltransferase [Acidimicrobiales bacterium]